MSNTFPLVTEQRGSFEIRCEGGRAFQAFTSDTQPIVVFSGVPDAVILTDAVLRAGQTLVTSATAKWTQKDVGKAFAAFGAGPAGTNLGGVTIAKVNSAGSLNLSAPATTSQNGVKAAYGTDNGPLLQPFLDRYAGTSVIVDVAPGMFAFGTGLTLPQAGVTLRGYGATFVASLIADSSTVLDTAHDLFFAKRVTDPTTFSLHANVAVDDTTVQVAGSTFVQGDRFALEAGALAFIYQVVSPPVNSGGNQTLTIDRPSQKLWTVGATTVAKLLSQPTGNVIDGITVTGAAQIYHEALDSLLGVLRRVTFDASILFGAFGNCSSFDTGGSRNTYDTCTTVQTPGGLAFESNESSQAFGNRLLGDGATLNSAGFQVNDSALITLENNVATRFTSGGINAVSTRFLSVRGGQVSDQTITGNGLYVLSCDGLDVDGLVALRNGGAGIFVDVNCSGTVSNSTFKDNAQNGVVNNSLTGMTFDSIEASGAGGGNPNVALNGSGDVTNLICNGGTGDSVVIGQSAKVLLNGFSLIVSPNNGARGILINGNADIVATIQNGTIALPSEPGGIFRGVYQNHAVSIIDNLTITGPGADGTSTSGIETITGDETVRLGSYRPSGLTNDVVMTGHCSRSISGSSGSPSLTATGDVAFADIRSTDRVLYTQRVLGGTGQQPTTTITVGTGFHAAYVSGDTSTWDYVIE